MSIRRNLIWDSGLSTGPRNAALDRAQLAHTRTEGDTLLRLHRHHPTVCLGAHEDVRHAVRERYCTEHGIPLVRRLTGGGALYLDPEQLCWTLTEPLYCATAWPGLERGLARLTRGIASGLRELGIDARYAPPNDIEVDGRKLGSVFATLDGDVWVAQGTLLLDIDMETLMRVLQVPKEKLSPEGIQSARQRFTAIRPLLGETPPSKLHDALQHGIEIALGHDFHPSLTLHERLIGHIDAFPQTNPTASDEALESFRKTGGSVLYANLQVDGNGERITKLELSGDIDVRPMSLPADLCAWLENTRIDDIERNVAAFFAREDFELLGFSPREVARTVRQAADRVRQQRELSLSLEQANTLMVHDPDGDGDTRRLLEKAEVMLVPYCAKPAWCEWRHEDGCSECGLCEVGEAYRMARERDMPAITIRNFEHLVETLDELKSQGVGTYMGMCCRNFYLKREKAFRESGMSAVLLDITGSNCYELQQEDLAYAGRFEAEAHLNGEVLEKVMRFVPSLDALHAKRAKG